MVKEGVQIQAQAASRPPVEAGIPVFFNDDVTSDSRDGIKCVNYQSYSHPAI